MNLYILWLVVSLMMVIIPPFLSVVFYNRHGSELFAATFAAGIFSVIVWIIVMVSLQFFSR